MGVCQIKDSPPKLTKSKQDREMMPYHCIGGDNFIPKIPSKSNLTHNWTSKKITKNIVNKETASTVNSAKTTTIKENILFGTTTKKYSQNVLGTRRSALQNDRDLLELLHFGFVSIPTPTTRLVSKSSTSPLPIPENTSIIPGIRINSILNAT